MIGSVRIYTKNVQYAVNKLKEKYVSKVVQQLKVTIQDIKERLQIFRNKIEKNEESGEEVTLQNYIVQYYILKIQPHAFLQTMQTGQTDILSTLLPPSLMTYDL